MVGSRAPEVHDLAPSRRSQRERREGTIAKLVDAAIASLLEVGYANTSVSEVCRRAGVSHGGLFRHFGTMLDLLMAASDEVGRRQGAAIEDRLQHAAASDEPLITMLHVVRDASRAPINEVFHELIVAARRDPALHRALSAFGANYANTIWQSVSRMPGAERFPPDVLAVVVSSVLLLFDGEALTRNVHAVPELEDARMKMLERLVKTLVVSSTAAAPSAAKRAASGAGKSRGGKAC